MARWVRFLFSSFTHRSYWEVQKPLSLSGFFVSVTYQTVCLNTIAGPTGSSLGGRCDGVSMLIIFSRLFATSGCACSSGGWLLEFSTINSSNTAYWRNRAWHVVQWQQNSLTSLEIIREVTIRYFAPQLGQSNMWLRFLWKNNAPNQA